ncbi:caspase family protein [Streptomyces sp. NBC_01207]|uniref:caspase family protein n=1 Tax=Streptomyces sp. NBC_01207 TaxID=2903772 RepID=UPI002E10CC11|nr:caspase family protein [Streptomyces sp. NBC_01207]
MTRPRLPNPAASRALLIGVHTYQHLEQLLPVRNNLTGLAATLRDERVWGLPLENVTVLEQPKNRKAVVDGIIDANRKASGTLLIYYSGHGLTDLRWSEELYLALPTTENLRTDTALPYTEVRRALGQNGVLRKQLVVVFDCCRSGRALRDEVADNARFADLAADVLQDDLPEQPFVAGHAVLTATHSRQAAMAPPGATYSTFTRALLDVLNEGLAGKPEVLDVESVYAALRDGAAPGSARPQLRSRGEPAALGIARNCSPQRGPGLPGPRPPGPPPPPQRTGVPARMPELVREYLQRQPWTPWIWSHPLRRSPGRCAEHVGGTPSARSRSSSPSGATTAWPSPARGCGTPGRMVTCSSAGTNSRSTASGTSSRTPAAGGASPMWSAPPRTRMRSRFGARALGCPSRSRRPSPRPWPNS